MEKIDPDTKLTRFLEEEKVFLEDLKKVDVENNWKRFLQSASRSATIRQTYPFAKRNRFFIRIAAAILILLVAITTLYFTTNLPAHQIIQVSTDSQLMELILSDETAITLNKGTTLTYPEKLNHRKREVSLAGEAYFQVEHAKKSPFYIYIGEWTVKVLGTSFNLREDGSGSIEVDVVKGVVLFYEAGNQDQAIRLTDGKRCAYNPATGEIHTTAIQSANYLFWKTKKLIYRDETLNKVFKELEVLFEQKIIISDPLILQNRWNSIHEGQKLNEILNELCLYFDLEYIQKDNTICVQRK